MAAGAVLGIGGLRTDDATAAAKKPAPPARKSSPAGKAGMPEIHPREEWYAASAPAPGLIRGAPTYLVVHHTETPNVDDDSLAWAHRLSRSIQDYHMNENGWSDAGQQFTISRGGHIMEGRRGSLAAARQGFFVEGTQVAGANAYTVGIENEGTYHEIPPPEALVESLTELLVWLCRQYDLNPEKAIVPHRHFNSTTCCGDRLVAMLPELRAAVKKRL